MRALALIRKIIAYFMFDIGIRVYATLCAQPHGSHTKSGLASAHGRFIYDLHYPSTNETQQNCLRHTETQFKRISRLLLVGARAHARSHMTTIKDAALSIFNRPILPAVTAVVVSVRAHSTGTHNHHYHRHHHSRHHHQYDRIKSPHICISSK